MHNIYYLGLSGEHRCPLGYLFSRSGKVNEYQCQSGKCRKYNKIIIWKALEVPQRQGNVGEFKNLPRKFTVNRHLKCIISINC